MEVGANAVGSWGGEAGVRKQERAGGSGEDSGLWAWRSAEGRCSVACGPAVMQDSTLACSVEGPGSRSGAGVGLVEAAFTPGSWGCVPGRRGGASVNGAGLLCSLAPCAPAFGMLCPPFPSHAKRG